MLAAIELTAEEKALYDGITWDDGVHVNHDKLRDQCETVAKLASSLIERNAIDKTRMAYFTDPAMNASNTNRSRMQVFEGNGTAGDAILQHPHFLPYLWYFINGPKLPKTVIDGFTKIIQEDRGTSGMVLDEAKAFVRKSVRDHGLDKTKAGEEFFKLCHEIGKGTWAEYMRTAAKTTK